MGGGGGGGRERESGFKELNMLLDILITVLVVQT